MAETTRLFEHEVARTPGQAVLRVYGDRRAGSPVNPLLYGKFCEHLGANIYHGMEAQILSNPTFARWRFSAGDHYPDGGVREAGDREQIARRIADRARGAGWPDAAPVQAAYFEGGACGWFRVGGREDVRFSPDVGPYGGRAQRVEVRRASRRAPHGIGQWIYLPLHRTRDCEFRIVGRAVSACVLRLNLSPAGEGRQDIGVEVALEGGWQTVSGRLTLPDGFPEDALYRCTLTTDGPAHFVLDRVLLYPGDHVGGADPDVIRLLRASRLPLLRWPGGNFASGYHWRDGIGPIDARPTVPNPAWEGLEFHLFGTDEFIAFCRAVGCAPMICVNAGDGTPEAAAAWVEYCNGPADTPMGRLRAENGHPEPYGIRYWEIGNELYGRWQVTWTTPAGYVDRYRRFCKAMRAVDPSICVLGCGCGNEPDSAWNRCLIEGAGGILHGITDHILTGGGVDAETDPVALYHAFMGYPTVLEGRYRALRDRMRAAGIQTPRLAITELQMFAHFRGGVVPDGRLSPETMPAPDTIAEALYLSGIVNTCIRLGDFVELLTHSATVNHGGGLRKVRERVYANPVHYAHALGSALAGGTPVAVRLRCGTFSTPRAFGHIPPLRDVPVLDAMAVLSAAGDLVLMLVHRGAECGNIALSVELAGYRAQGQAEVTTLCGETCCDRNTLEAPERIVPRSMQVDVTSGDRLALTLPPFSLTRVVLKK